MGSIMTNVAHKIEAPNPKEGEWSFSRILTDDGEFACHRIVGRSGLEIQLQTVRSDSDEETFFDIKFKSPSMDNWQQATVVLRNKGGGWEYEPIARLVLSNSNWEENDVELRQVAEGMRAFLRYSSNGQSDFTALLIERDNGGV
jgi:hypothetical protein